jgi:hypothetical protein
VARAPWLSDLNDDEGWVKASSSSAGGECVEVKHTPAAIGVRDSKRPAGFLTFPPSSWTTFLLSR